MRERECVYACRHVVEIGKNDLKFIPTHINTHTRSNPEGPRLNYKGSWKSTYVSLTSPHTHTHTPLRDLPPLYSDVLYAPYKAIHTFTQIRRKMEMSKDNCMRLERPSEEVGVCVCVHVFCVCV